jgi:cytochrome c-type biogenesis protein CcmH
LPSPDRSPATALTVAVILAVVPLALGSGVDEYEHAAKTILCDCGCHPQSVHDCACSRAAEMRDEIRALVDQGQSGEQVIARYVAEHGESIRIAPVARGFNLLAWIGPLAGLVVALVAILLVARRWAAASAAASAAAAAAAGPAATARADDGAYRERLRREIEELR